MPVPWLTSCRRAAERPLVLAALVLAAIKLTEFFLDPQAIFFADSGGFLRNAIGLKGVIAQWPFLHVDFLWPTRSFVYGWLIRLVAIPFHSFRAIVAMQLAMGGVTAWLLMLVLLRFFRVRPWIGVLAAVVFALDPVQLVHEHLVLSETSTLLAIAVYLAVALHYLEAPSLKRITLLSFLGLVIVSLRILYVPVVSGCAVLLPLMAYWRPIRRPGTVRRLALALVVSCASTLLFQAALRAFTGRASHREPAYNYESGYFLLADVSPIVEPEDSPDPGFAAVIRAQRQSPSAPLIEPLREHQLWRPDGLIRRLLPLFGGVENSASNQLANRVARNAIRRDPLGFLKLGVETYMDYWKELPSLGWHLDVDNGTYSETRLDDHSVSVIAAAFRGYNVLAVTGRRTPSRRYHLAARYWVVFLLFTWPFLTGLAWVCGPVNRRGVFLLFAWSGLVLIATCLGAGAVYRYLHPFSFPAIAACALLLDKVAAGEGSRLAAVLRE